MQKVKKILRNNQNDTGAVVKVTSPYNYSYNITEYVHSWNHVNAIRIIQCGPIIYKLYPIMYKYGVIGYVWSAYRMQIVKYVAINYAPIVYDYFVKYITSGDRFQSLTQSYSTNDEQKNNHALSYKYKRKSVKNVHLTTCMTSAKKIGVNLVKYAWGLGIQDKVVDLCTLIADNVNMSLQNSNSTATYEGPSRYYPLPIENKQIEQNGQNSNDDCFEYDIVDRNEFYDAVVHQNQSKIIIEEIDSEDYLS